MGLFDFTYFIYILTKIFDFIKRNWKFFLFLVVGIIISIILFNKPVSAYVYDSSTGKFSDLNYNSADVKNIENYNVVNSSAEHLNKFLEFLQGFPAYRTGNYYYFMYFFPYTNGFNCFLINKEQLNSIDFGGFKSELKYNSAICLLVHTGNGQAIINNLVKDCYVYNSKGDFDYSKFRKTSFPEDNGASSYYPFRLYCTSLDNLTFSVNFLTDIPYNIDFTNVLGTSVIYTSEDSPYIANTHNELADLSSDTINIVPMIGKDIHLTLVNETLNKEIFSIDLSDDEYSPYYSRLDLSNPFSDLAYMIPWSALPSFTYTGGQTFNWKLTYYIGATGLYTMNYSVMSTYSGGSVGGGSSPRWWLWWWLWWWFFWWCY